MKAVMTMYVGSTDGNQIKTVSSTNGKNGPTTQWMIKLEIRDSENHDLDRGGNLCGYCRRDSKINVRLRPNVSEH